MAMESEILDSVRHNLANFEAARESLRIYRAGEHEPFLEGVLHQGADGARASRLEDEFCVAEALQLFRAGHMLVRCVGSDGVSGGPFPDCLRDKNQAALDTLPAPFTATVYDTHSGPDGVLLWSEPIIAIQSLGNGEHRRVTVPPGRASLEIGTMSGCTGFVRMVDWPALARWPYGSRGITICMLHPLDLYYRRATADLR